MSEGERLLSGLRDQIGKAYMDHGEVPAAVLTKDSNDQLVAIPLNELASNMTMFNLYLRNLRSNCSFFAVMLEIIAVPTSSKLDCHPSDHPEKTESVILSLYEGLTVSIWRAGILRSGSFTRLSDWHCLNSLESQPFIVDGPPEWN